MRFYDLKLTGQDNGKTFTAKEWTSHPNGKYDAGAQNIMFDIPVVPFSTPTGGQTITIEGISLNDLQQGTNFAGLDFQLSAGFKKGLPLANPLQSGLIAVGQVFQSFANWEGTEMSLSFVIFPAGIKNNLVLIWLANTELSLAISNMLKVAFPDIKVNMNIGSFLQGHDEIANHGTLEEMSGLISGLTANMGNEVRITLQNGVFNVFDTKFTPKPIQIQFTDLIGQPSWIDPQTLQVKLVMRADVSVGAKILMPAGMTSTPGQVLTVGSSLPSNLKYKTTFTGQFTVIEMRQLGNFRTPDGSQWSTIINAIPS